jgi:O-acetylhomoserine/O-acetylserine sulfhydrylase-like pyridoxal-dependent enzyme
VRAVNPTVTQFETSCFDGSTSPATSARAGAQPVQRARRGALPDFELRFRQRGQAAARFSGAEAGNVYARFTNPTVTMLQERLAALEGAEACIATASGMAAILSTVMALMKAGEHIVASRSIFGATQQLFGNILPRFGVETTFVDRSGEGFKRRDAPDHGWSSSRRRRTRSPRSSTSPRWPASPMPAARCWRSTTASARRPCSARWNWAPTW